MTKRKHPSENQRPRRYLGQVLRTTLKCPLCVQGTLRVLTYRRVTVVMECARCGLQFSVKPVQLAETLRREAPWLREYVSSVDPGVEGDIQAEEDSIRKLHEHRNMLARRLDRYTGDGQTRDWLRARGWSDLSAEQIDSRIREEDARTRSLIAHCEHVLRGPEREADPAEAERRLSEIFDLVNKGRWFLDRPSYKEIEEDVLRILSRPVRAELG